MIERRLRYCVTAVLFVFLVPFQLSDAGNCRPHTLVILHTNDMHASFLPREAMWIKELPRPHVGGFVELEAVVDSIRRAAPTTLLLDGGDVMTGNPITERPYKGVLGGALFEMMNMIGYDAWSPGNHDLDISQDNLRGLAGLAKFPTLSANLVDTSGRFPLNNVPYTVIERGGLRVGIIGVISQVLSSLVNQHNIVGLRVLSPSETIQRLVDKLDPETDLLIALTHQGAEEDSVLATQVTGLDIIIGGHSHTRIKKPRLINNILVAQAGSNVENLGVIEVTVDNDRVTSSDGRLITLWTRKDRPATPVSAMVDSLRNDIEREYSEVIGTLTANWMRGSGPSAIGSFIAEAQREAAAAQVGFMNIHGIRRDLPAGPITKRDLFEVLPFRNVLVTFQLSGAQLKGAVAHVVSTGAQIQITGLSASYRRSPDGAVQIVAAEVLGKPILDDQMYVCAASDFFVGQAQRYIGVEIAQPVYLPQTLFQVVEHAIRQAGTITPSQPWKITGSGQRVTP